MTTIHLLAHLEPLLTAAARFYAVAGEIFSITAILWCLRLMSDLAETSYKAGVIAGKFYKRHLHKWVIRAAAFYWLGCQLTWEGLRWTYQHRSEILAAANECRDRIGKAFSYQSPAMEALTA